VCGCIILALVGLLAMTTSRDAVALEEVKSDPDGVVPQDQGSEEEDTMDRLLDKDLKKEGQEGEGGDADQGSDGTPLGWLDARKAVWDKESEQLRSYDKAMFGALRDSLKDPKSVQWARFMRHKGVQGYVAKSGAGHVWKSHKGQHRQGTLQETSQVKVGAQHQTNKKKLCDATVQQHHGYFNILKSNSAAPQHGAHKKNYFYWMFEAREAPKDAPLILWLTGGPGCSSMVALMSENGPCTVAKGGQDTVPNPYSWNKKANIIFLDQPAGTGFSYGTEDEYDTDEAEVSEDIYHFMQEFVTHHSEYHKNDFYIFGESYAGHFVPAAAHRIFQGNKMASKNDASEYIALRGFGIGNGLTDPEIQYQYYPDMAFKPGHAPAAVDADTYHEMKDSVAECTSAIHDCQTETSKCPAAKELCSMKLVVPIQERGLNVYDMRKQCTQPPLCYTRFGDVSTFLNKESVMLTLGVYKRWETCNLEVNSGFSKDWMKNYASNIPDMLQNGYAVLIYAGDVDFICNWMGNKAWTMQMDWPGHDEFTAAKDAKWKVGGEVKGEVRHAQGLNFVRIHNAGHMVPMDQPEAALAMLDQFLSHKTLLVTD